MLLYLQINNTQSSSDLLLTMDFGVNWFDPVFTILGYGIPLIEIISVTAGIIAVYFAARENILTWPIGLVNVTTAFFIYYHVQLYSDMFLQLYFFSISIYGWIIWKFEKSNKIPLKYLTSKQRIYISLLILIASYVFGKFIANIHLLFPNLFPTAAVYPYLDSFVAISSIVANTLLAKRIIENWILWILINIICVYLYIQREILFIALEFFIFLGLAIYGIKEWLYLKKLQDQMLKSE
ncbi:MAG: nicotinamide mononucleotide transporter [Saprospiraceae bacterium]|nr:nicotinamide mononucleotide transporter [Saprospiraceae bacterium]